MLASTRKCKSEKYGVEWEPMCWPGGKCSLCTRSFSMLELRRHCRLCGKVVCGPCQFPERLCLVAGESAKAVCDPCGQRRQREEEKSISQSDRAPDQPSIAGACVEQNTGEEEEEEHQDPHVEQDSAVPLAQKKLDVVVEDGIINKYCGEDLVIPQPPTTPTNLRETYSTSERMDPITTAAVNLRMQPVDGASSVGEVAPMRDDGCSVLDGGSTPRVLVPSPSVRAELDKTFGEQAVDQLLDVSVMQQRVAFVANVLQQADPEQQVITCSSAFATPPSLEGTGDVAEFFDVADNTDDEIDRLLASMAALEAAAEELRVAMATFQGHDQSGAHDGESLCAWARSTLENGDEDGRLEAALQQILADRADNEREHRHSLIATLRRQSKLVSDLLTDRLRLAFL